MREPEPQVTPQVSDAAKVPPRLPPMGAKGHGMRAPRHTTAYSIETNVERIANQINTGRRATYD